VCESCVCVCVSILGRSPTVRPRVPAEHGVSTGGAASEARARQGNISLSPFSLTLFPRAAAPLTSSCPARVLMVYCVIALED